MNKTVNRNIVLASFLLIILFVASPLAIALSFFALSSGYPIKKVAPQTMVFASLPGSHPKIILNADSSDARVAIIEKYLKKYKSPLVPYAEKFVLEADKNGLDFRLLVAIGQQESNLCKFAPEGTHNCWGWGIHKSGTLGFDSYEHAIEVVSLGLKKKYIDQGLRTPDEIMARYTPHSNGSWAFGVNSFMESMQ